MHTGWACCGGMYEDGSRSQNLRYSSTSGGSGSGMGSCPASSLRPSENRLPPLDAIATRPSLSWAFCQVVEDDVLKCLVKAVSIQADCEQISVKEADAPLGGFPGQQNRPGATEMLSDKNNGLTQVHSTTHASV